jgi:hypothetical protein
MKLERRHQPLLPPAKFRGRLAKYAALAFGVIGVSLLIGVAGYHWWGELAWLDSLVNAAMILGGMGPVDPVRSTAGKWFESAYALYSGIALLTSVGLLFAPVVHRVLHHFHLEEEEPGAS